ncbi:MAG: hypothetical protein ACYC8T_13340 [Myxococcaceae bacterium]
MALFERGSLSLGRIAGVAVRMHWTAPLGLFVFTGFRFDPVAWLCFLGVVLVHELGHALVVKACRATPVAIELTGFGGLCYWRGEVSPVGRAAIAWGGVWAQLVLLLAAEAHLWLGPPLDDSGLRIISALTAGNAWMIAMNLLPLAPLDGAEAWRLPVLLGRGLRARLPGRRGTGLPRIAPGGVNQDEAAFEAGERREEVEAIAQAILSEARKEPPP